MNARAETVRGLTAYVCHRNHKHGTLTAATLCAIDVARMVPRCFSCGTDLRAVPLVHDETCVTVAEIEQ